jgi:putative ABC transport system permease protein
MAIAVLGCALGCALTFPAASAFGQAVSQFFPVFQVSALTVTLQALSALIVGLVAGIVPAVRAQSVGIAEALRRIA